MGGLIWVTAEGGAFPGVPAPIWPISCEGMPCGTPPATEPGTGPPASRIGSGLGAMARGSTCCKAWVAADMDGCCAMGAESISEGERLVEARVCWTDRMVCASADSAAA